MSSRPKDEGSRRVGRLGALLVGLVVLGDPRPADAAGDPYQVYWTIKTPHFRITYPRSIEPVAERIADHVEEIQARLLPSLGEAPKEVVEIFVTDDTESANGSATAFPYNTMRLFVTAPDDMSPLGDYEDWILELVTHEHTHILHTNQIRGLPAIGNAVLGKTFVPNQVQPRWILEGLAVLEESRHTSAGRNRSSLFDMYLRADVLEGKLASLDQVSNFVRRWPSGNVWYLYGSRFLTWISEVYGDHVMKTVAADYGHLIVPWGINRSVRRATGNTYAQKDDRPALFDGFRAHLKRRYDAQLQEAFAKSPRREGTRISHIGRVLVRPRFVPAAAETEPGHPELVFYSNDGHSRPGFYRAPLARPDDRRLFVRAVGEGTLSFDARGNAVFSAIEIHKRIYPFSDLSFLPVGAESPEGTEDARARLTRGVRAIDPDVSRSGREIAFVINRKGTQYLALADLSPENTLGEPSVVVPERRFEQVYTPRFSPDGKRIAFSHWAVGGLRDVRVVDRATRAVTAITKDRAMDLQPSWSPDGKLLFFSSDRGSAIHNVFAWDFEQATLYQVTNVATGAFMPEVSPDGKTLLYVGYGSAGYDLYTMPLDRSQWTVAPPYEDRHPATLPSPPHHDWEKVPYDPWPTLRPHAYTLDYGPGTFGQTLVVGTTGSDVARIHGFAATVSVDTARSDPQFYVAYRYGRLPMDLELHAFRTLTPRTGYRLSGRDTAFIEEHHGIGSSVSYGVSTPFSSYGVSLGYDASMYRGSLPLGPTIDPQEGVTRMPVGLGLVGVTRALAQYSDVERTTYSVGPSRGTYLAFSAEYAGRETASEFDFYGFAYGAARYQPIPLLQDHTLFLGAQGGFLGGSYPRSGAFYTGGFVDMPIADSLKDGVFQGGFVLRGYPPGSYVGRQYHLTTAEYRAPLWLPERGLSTLPLFLSRVSGAGFVDYGGAFDDLDVEHFRSQLHTGYGGELLVDLIFGYGLGVTARLGHARGVSREAYQGGHTYLVLSGNY